MARLLIVHHSPTSTTRRLTDAVIAGAQRDEIERVDVRVREALEVKVDDLDGVDGFLLGTSANFGYMSGALKHFFDSFFLDMGGDLADDGSAGAGPQGRKPFGVWVHGRYDTTGATRSVQSIVGALPWVPAAPVLEIMGDVNEADLGRAYELGGTLAALLMP